MGVFREWIQNVVVFLLLTTMVGQLIPNDKYKKYARLTMGLLLIMVILLPLTKLTGIEDRFYQNFMRESYRISAANASIGEQVFSADGQFLNSYKEMIAREIRLYFESESMTVSYCYLDMDENAGSKSYGEVTGIRIGLQSKDRYLISGDSGNRETEDIAAVNIPEIAIGEEKDAVSEPPFVPEEKIKQWKEDISLQFGVDAEQLKLEILS